MAVGQTYAINPGSAIQYFIPSGFSAPTIGVLNPNDGIAYIARNRQASNTSVGSWDYKVPSQSYALLPGLNWESVGVFYLDQSGANTKGEITVYPLETKTVIPVFQAIGRANQSAGTTVDISTGNQPQNPPANTGRLWIDNSGNLNVLNSSGVNHTVLDSANAPTYVLPIVATAPLGGDLYGTVNNGHVNAHTNPVQMDRTINVQWGALNPPDRIVVWSDSNMYIDTNTGIINIRPAGTTALAISSSGIQVTGNATATGNLQAGSSNPATLQNNALTLYGDTVIQRWNPGQMRISSGGLTVNGQIVAETGGIQVNAGNIGVSAGSVLIPNWGYYLGLGSSQIFDSGNTLYLRAAGGSGVYVQNTGGGWTTLAAGTFVAASGSFQLSDSNARIERNGNGVRIVSYDSHLYLMDASGNQRLTFDGSSQSDFYGNNGSANYRFFHFDGSWEGTQAANFQVQSDIRYKTNVVEVSDDECVTRLRTPGIPVITWTPDNPMPDSPSVRDIGFSAQAMAAAAPETVTVDNEGNHFLAYGQLTAVLWGALRATDATLQAVIAALPPGMRPPNVYVAP